MAATAVPAIQTRDIVVIGASAGGVEALPNLLLQLPATLPAAVFVVLHQRAREHSHLVQILQRATSLPVSWAEQGERLERGRIYAAPPDIHMTLESNHVRLSRGPRENHARPSIDRLFRSAAANHGARTIGVLLSGLMDDGVAGLHAIKQAGGRAIVQEPSDAEYAELPGRALASFTPDATLRIDEMGAALLDLTMQVAADERAPNAIVIESELDRGGTASQAELDQIGNQSIKICPECGGPLWEVGDHELRRWRCYLGHVVGAREMLDASNEHLETALWSAVRALHERASTWETLARDAIAGGNDRIADEYSTRGREAREQAEIARRFMLDLVRHEHRGARARL